VTKKKNEVNFGREGAHIKRVVKKRGNMHSYIEFMYVADFVALPEQDSVESVLRLLDNVLFT